MKGDMAALASKHNVPEPAEVAEKGVTAASARQRKATKELQAASQAVAEAEAALAKCHTRLQAAATEADQASAHLAAETERLALATGATLPKATMMSAGTVLDVQALCVDPEKLELFLGDEFSLDGLDVSDEDGRKLIALRDRLRKEIAQSIAATFGQAHATLQALHLDEENKVLLARIAKKRKPSPAPVGRDGGTPAHPTAGAVGQVGSTAAAASSGAGIGVAAAASGAASLSSAAQQLGKDALVAARAKMGAGGLPGGVPPWL